ncbi:DUF1549 domain-containing protein [Luteolibacter yonseiensis]|uniref:DUF1549 domain-containing protein n=1 Tax=Luteolibacter yonseiensis TaxID=1144680 RepID=A0A934R2C8_9BACT|nr:DUF1549 domain-containing protein [Luteolibacter yonseiensis]MBK1815564.1 DUF1549 domain-containing protein [Luteolibacter yonseiensis]
MTLSQPASRNRLVAYGTCGFALFSSLAAAPDFVHEVAPILKKHCTECHTATKKKAGFSMDTEESFRAGSENGAVVDAAHPEKSLLLELISTDDEDVRMPPKGKGLNDEQVEVIRAWLAEGAKWEPGFAFKKPAYEPPLRPRNPELPAAVDGRTNPIDRIIDHYLAQKNAPRPAPLDDTAFIRRVHLDLVGLLPDVETVRTFAADTSPDKREKLVDTLLADKTAYTEHWLTFWNDLLRNDYAGTGYIDGGRKQISGWLYQALYDNMPYDQFVRQLVAPTAESEGFADGIKWRGSVSAAQITPMQYAQSVGQTFLGINLKCASCHDSFVDRWKLSEAYGLAAIYSDEQLEMFRCDKPTGKKAEPAWLFPELGSVDASLPRAERLKQLAALITHPENGRTPRAVTNRLWQRLMGRGIVHPVDAMQSAPWNEDLLDFLGANLAANHQDLKQTLRLICLSQAYQSKSESFEEAPKELDYVYKGPRPKRLTAEEFTDAIWQICGTAPGKIDAPVTRHSTADGPGISQTAAWLWSDLAEVPAGKKITLRKNFQLAKVPDFAAAVASADNSFELYVNGTKAGEGTSWEDPTSIPLNGLLKSGQNEVLFVVTNGGAGPNPAGGIFHALLKQGDKWAEIASDTGWEATAEIPDARGRFKSPPRDWKPAVAIAANPWAKATQQVSARLAATVTPLPMVRASLLKSDLLMRTLGRPNREQIVSTRPTDLATLEAMDLNNGAILDMRLAEGAKALLDRKFASSAALASYVWQAALARDPTPEEMRLALTLLGTKPGVTATQDFLWGIFMLPEFQIVR